MTPNRLAFKARSSVYDGLRRDLRQLVWVNSATLILSAVVLIMVLGS